MYITSYLRFTNLLQLTIHCTQVIHETKRLSKLVILFPTARYRRNMTGRVYGLFTLPIHYTTNCTSRILLNAFADRITVPVQLKRERRQIVYKYLVLHDILK